MTRDAGEGLIYLDHLASTPLDPRVLAAMLPWFAAQAAANPHAQHRPGWRTEAAIDHARAAIAALIGARPGEIVFTSGATEANNLALLGAVPADWPVLVSAIEHASVMACLALLGARGHRVTILPVDGDGVVDLESLQRQLAGGPAFVSVMSANNEIGTIQPLDRVAALCRNAGARLHVDAVQSLATAALDIDALGIDLLSLSGHKLYGPQGVGALFIRDGVKLSPRSLGGNQQEGRRAGTVPTALAVGLGEACRLARREREGDAARLRILRERLHAGLEARFDLRRNSPGDHSLPGCLNVTIPGVDAADILLDLPELALSTGSACGSRDRTPSTVLRAIGRSVEACHASFRFGLGRTTTAAEIDRAIGLFTAAIGTQR